MTAAEAFQRAVGLHQAGRLAEAASLYADVLATEPRHFDALHLLGVLEGQRGRIAEAERLIGQAFALDPTSMLAACNHANMLRELGRLEEALVRYDQALALDRSDLPSLTGRGYALLGLGRPDEAARVAARALALAPADMRALNVQAAAFSGLKQMTRARIGHDRTLAVRPDRADVWTDRGRILLELEGPDAARASHARALVLEPALAEAVNGRAIALRRLERPAEALTWFARAFAVRGDYAEARFNCGLAYRDLYRSDAAVTSLRRALALRPELAEALQVVGTVLLGIGFRDEAIAALDRADILSPTLPGLWRNRISAHLYSDRTSPADIHRWAVAGARRDGPQTPLPPPENDRDPDRRLRIGFLSSDFHNHPVARTLRPVFAHRDRAVADYICYAHERRKDDLADWYRNAADSWRSVGSLTDRQIAESVRRDGIDILVLLAGHFDHNHPLVAAWRPAPVQVSMYDAATSGIAEMDYFVGDSVLVPEGRAEPFVERIARLPVLHFYGPAAPLPVTVRPPAADGAVVFGSFNNPAKLSPVVLGLWNRILLRLPSATLVLKYKDDYARRELKDIVLSAVARDGVEADRVTFAAAGEVEREHLARYGAVDIALDAYPFTGATTSFESLWMGVPVVTLLGDGYLRRMTASHLIPLGLDDLVARTPADYVEIAVGLALDSRRRQALRHTLRDRLLASPLMDGPAYARSVEAMLRSLWRRWAEGRSR